MTARPVLTTLSVLFVIAGAGQFVGSVPALADISVRQDAVPETVAGVPQIRSVLPDGIALVEENAAADDTESSMAAMSAQRLELRLATQEMQAERERMEAAKADLAQRRHDERKRLAGLYARMPANKAATILEALPAAEAAALLSAMSDEPGALILSEMLPDRAIEITQVLAGTL